MPITALVIQVPEAEAVVGELRRRFDPSALQGVPAHVTVLVPFKDSSNLAGQDLKRLESVFAASGPFTYCFARLGRFPDATYLAPEDPVPFVGLTRDVEAAFPEFPPYGGLFPDVVPHLTVAHGAGPGLDAAQEELHGWVQCGVPIRGRCSEVLLLQQEPGGWQVRHRFRLGSGDA